ncbi:MAG: hypothetical protein ACE5DX_02400 [Candidatus Dojkabacteria bacterium]
MQDGYEVQDYILVKRERGNLADKAAEALVEVADVVDNSFQTYLANPDRVDVMLPILNIFAPVS